MEEKEKCMCVEDAGVDKDYNPSEADEDWAKAAEKEILAFVKEKSSCKPVEIAARLKVSEDSTGAFIGRLIRSGKIRITGITTGSG